MRNTGLITKLCSTDTISNHAKNSVHSVGRQYLSKRWTMVLCKGLVRPYLFVKGVESFK